jgi:acetate kinase
MDAAPSILTINGGSSSVRFALFEECETPRRVSDGSLDRIGLGGTNLTFRLSPGKPRDSRAVDSLDRGSAVPFLLDWLEAQGVLGSVRAVGHRVVHGMTHTEPERVTPELLGQLRGITPYDPEHLPLEIEVMEALRERHP